MARGYPKFLFSNPENVKTPGPFIVHLLEPRLVFKVLLSKSEFDDSQGIASFLNNAGVLLLDKNLDESKWLINEEVLEAAVHWLDKQIALGFIKL